MPSDPIDDFNQTDYDYWDEYEAYERKTEGWEKPILSMAALLVVSLGVRTKAEWIFAVACQLVFWVCGHKGPDGMYNALAGVQTAYGRYKYSAFPTLLDAYNSIEDLSKQKRLTERHIMIWVIYGLGFGLAKYRVL